MKKTLCTGVLVLSVSACSVWQSDSDSTTRNPAGVYYEVPTEFKGKNFIEEHNSGLLKKVDLIKTATFIKWARGNPIPMFRTLRNEAPLFETGQIPHVRKYLSKEEAKGKKPPTLIVSLDKDVRDLLSQPEIFSVRLYQHKMDQSVGKYMLGYDKKEVNEEKPWMRSMLKREDIPAIKEKVKELTLKAIKEGNVNGRLEVVNSVARRVPLELTGEYFGMPGPDLRTMYKWSRDTQYSYFHNAKNEEIYDNNAITSGQEMQEYLKGYLKQKRASKDYLKNDTVLDRMLRKDVSDAEMLDLYDGRVRTNIIGTLVGGVETTQAAITQALSFLLDNPEILKGATAAAMNNDDSLLEKYVWEALRFRPVNPFVIRYAEKDYVIAKGTSREYQVKKGQVVLIATHSAMFDESTVKNPYEFRLDRGGVNDKESIYYHFGYGHHKCLGDYVAQVEVPEVIKHILRLKGLKSADGQMKSIGDHDNIGALAIEEDKEPSPFPESFIVEFDKPIVRGERTIADPRFLFEDYLMDYDRTYFRTCLSALETKSKLKNIFRAIKVRRMHTDAYDLFLCRLPKKFHDCSGVLTSDQHENKYGECKQHLSEIEKFFFETEVKGVALDPSKIPVSVKESVNSGFEFEEDLKFYDRADYRQTFLNPVSLKSYPVDVGDSTQKLLFYARVPLNFRKCLGPKVIIKKMNRSEACSTCMKDPEIRLDSLTTKYYKEIILDGNDD